MSNNLWLLRHDYSWTPCRLPHARCILRVFAFYIVFDTQLMLGSWGGHKLQFDIDDYAFAALNLYLDIINLFLYILEIVGTRE
eukprot:Skav203188  [mRNA]  locus=scaffold39:361567:361815:+ [translate_table: standard]